MGGYEALPHGVKRKTANMTIVMAAVKYLVGERGVEPRTNGLGVELHLGLTRHIRQ